MGFKSKKKLNKNSQLSSSDPVISKFDFKSSIPTKQIIHVSEFVRNFVKSHVAPNQRAQSDLCWRPELKKTNSQNINLVPQSTRCFKSKNKSKNNFLTSSKIGRRHPNNKRNKKKHLEISHHFLGQLHQLWLGYFKSIFIQPYGHLFQSCKTEIKTPLLLNSPSWANPTELFLRMNFIGAYLKILQSKTCQMVCLIVALL